MFVELNMLNPVKPAAMRDKWMELAFENLPTAALVLDADGRIDAMNERACLLLGIPCATLVGRELKEVFGIWDLRSAHMQDLSLEQVFQLGLSQAEEGLVLRTGKSIGKELYALVLVPISDGNRKVIGAVGTLSLPARPAAVAQEEAPGHAQALFVRHAGRYVRIQLSELLWVEAMENYVQLQTVKERLVVHATLKSFDDALAGRGFQRIHRSFVVRKDEIERIEENHVIVHGTALPVGKSYRSELIMGLSLI